MGMQPPDKGSAQQQLRPTHVVTSFLMRTDMTEPRLLIVQRSQRVGSYHGQWAGISGFVEPDTTPEEQAYTEIREETSLQREQVRLLKRGEVVEHIDPALGRQDRKSTRLNSSHANISYAVFCLKKKKK